MRNHRHMFTLIMLATVLLLAACGRAEPVATPTLVPTAMLTATPDLCAPENISAEIQAVHRLMREFDDASALSRSTAREQLKPTIADLQRIRREAEDQKVPACMQAFKELQLVHMNTFIQTLLDFMGGADQETVNRGLGLSNQLHNQYMIEMARLQGVTILPTLSPVPTIGTPGASPVTEIPTPSVAVVTNLGSTAVNLLTTASLDAQNVGVLGVGQSALALGQTANGAWVMIEIPSQPGRTAWVYAALVQLSGPGPLPVMTP